jgi:hypothetical protein
MADRMSVLSGQQPGAELAESVPSRSRSAAAAGGQRWENRCVPWRWAWRGPLGGTSPPGTFKPEIILLSRMPIAARFEASSLRLERRLDRKPSYRRVSSFVLVRGRR